jgi:hypothetical protein
VAAHSTNGASGLVSSTRLDVSMRMNWRVWISLPPTRSIRPVRSSVDLGLTNFARAVGKRRRIDRALMQGEWPILLRVMGKTSVEGRYLSLAELRGLFVEQRLPPRITQRLAKTVSAPGWVRR